MGTSDHNEILSDFGKKIGIPDLQFDEQGYCCLGFDDVKLNIEHDPTLKHFLVYAAVGKLPPRPDVELMQRLLDLNYASLVMGKGAIGVHREAQNIMFVERISSRDLDAQDFEDAVRSIVDRVEALMKMVGSSDFLRAEGATADQSLVSADMMMRV